MKIISTLILFGFAITGCSKAQNLNSSDVPEAVKTAFHTMYPYVASVKWEMEEGHYEAEFDLNKTETSVLFEADGSYMQKESEIGVSALPQPIVTYVSQNMPGKKIKEASVIVSADGTTTYEAEIDGDDYIFDPNGNLISHESDGEDDED